jgi:hypothetical protein
MEPNVNLKMHLFKKGMSQRKLAFGTGIDEGQISKLIRYGIGTPEIRDSVSDYLNVPQGELFKRV